jgi:glycosyltransferase involved in cell wall biosynthesis
MISPRYRIAVIAACPFPYARGTPIRILRMAEALAARGHHVEVVTYHLGQNIEDLPFKVHRIPAVPTYHKVSPGPAYQKLAVLDLLLSAKILWLVNTGGFDLIHAHHYEGLLASLPAAALKKIPLIFDVHTLLSSELPHYRLGLPAGLLKWIGTRLDHWLPPRADHIIAVTNTARDRLIRDVGVPAARITTVYGGVEMAHFLEHGRPESAARDVDLIYAGNLAPYQGVDLMLRAFRLVLDKRPQTTLKIVTGSSPAAYEALVRELQLADRIRVVRDDFFQLPGQLHSAAIALSPRVVCDGLPLKVLNYMATGRAIVAFKGSAEVLVDGQTGLVVPDGDVQAFAAAILHLLENPVKADRLGRGAQANVQEFFVWEESVKLLEQVYADVLDRR